MSSQRLCETNHVVSSAGYRSKRFLHRSRLHLNRARCTNSVHHALCNYFVKRFATASNAARFAENDFALGEKILSNGQMPVAYSTDHHLDRDAFAPHTAVGIRTDVSAEGLRACTRVPDRPNQTTADAASDRVLRADGKIMAAGTAHRKFSVVPLIP